MDFKEIWQTQGTINLDWNMFLKTFVVLLLDCTLPKTNSSHLPWSLLKRKEPSSNHQCSGAMLVSKRVYYHSVLPLVETFCGWWSIVHRHSWPIGGCRLMVVKCSPKDQTSAGTWKTRTYGWWTKSCTTKDDNYPIIHRVLTIPGGAGFFHQQYHWVFG